MRPEEKIEQAAKKLIKQEDSFSYGWAYEKKVAIDSKTVKSLMINLAKSDVARDYWLNVMIPQFAETFEDMVKHITEGELRKWNKDNFLNFIKSKIL